MAIVAQGRTQLGCVAVLATVLAGCGRIGFDFLAPDPASPDAADPLPPTLIGETLVLPTGWSAEVWFDFSDFFTFVADDYLDVTYLYSNRPHHMFLLSPPFVPGIGLMGNQEILELSSTGEFTRHDYFQVLPEGPDLIWDAQACGGIGSTGITPGLCVAAGSQNAGDGIFRIESDWAMSVVTTDNNVTVVAYDAAGSFDAKGAPTLYWGGPTGLREMGGASVYPNNMNGGFARMLDDGNLLLSSMDASNTDGVLVTLETGTHQVRELARSANSPGAVGPQNNLYYAIAEGPGDGFPGIAYVIEEGKRLKRIEQDGSLTLIAETAADEDWIWVAALMPGTGHALSDPGPGIFILEFNPTTETNRVIRLAP